MNDAAPPALDPATLSGLDVDDPLWYKDAVIYQLNVKTFLDSNDDGIGDFQGLTSKLGYIRDLGVNTIWLMPFYPSPLKDDGYDIADYKNVHPQYGTLDDFRTMLREAHRLGLKVVTELVINHTSDQHPWFQAARKAPPGSPERDFYVWSDTDQKYLGTRIIFIDTETSNWTFDPVAKAVLLAPLLQPPAGPEFRQPAGDERGARDHALLARHGRRRLPFGRHPVSRGARGHQ